MKRLLLVLALIFASDAFGADIWLPVPYATNTYPSTYFFRMAIVTGFDGNYVTGESTGITVSGHSGVGSTIHRTYECVQWTWDLAGNVVDETVLDPLHACSGLDPTLTFTNAGYTAWTTVYQYYPATHFPMLTTQ